MQTNLPLPALTSLAIGVMCVGGRHSGPGS
jgi:hypothetical protein